MRCLCRTLVMVGLIPSACPADEIGTGSAGNALGDLVIQGLDRPLRLRVYATHDDVPWNDYGTTARSEQLQSLFHQLDSDQDGRLAPDEARRLPPPEALGRTARLQGVNVAFNYRVLDVDGDGFASMGELQAYLDEFSQPGAALGFIVVRNERNPGDIFSALDADRNRRLTDDEWSAVAGLLERDRDGNRVLTPDELRDSFSELFGPEFVAAPITRRGSAVQSSLVAALESPGTDEPDGVVHLQVHDAGPGAPPTIDVQLHDGARSLGVTIDTDASQRIRLRSDRRFVEFGFAQSGPRSSIALSAALIRQFEAMTETLGRPLTGKDDLPPELKSVFTIADFNGDGNLERLELDRCIAGYVAATTSSAASQLTMLFVPERRGLSTLIDGNRDGRLSMREIQGLPAQLASLIDDDGTIGFREVPATAAVIFCRGAPADTLDPALSADYGPDWFIRADRNSDGDLDAEEFMGPAEVFATLDLNGDGWLALDEALRVNEAELIPSSGGATMNLLLISFLAGIMASGTVEAPAASTGADPALADQSAEIDRLFEADWHARNVAPAELTSDAEFLRRVTLDLTGVIPDVGEARAFLADAKTDKRARWVDQLLRRPRHAAHLANVWREVLLPRAVSEPAAAGFEKWMQSRFAANVPYDALVRDILLARGRLGVSPPTMYFAALQSKPSELAASSSRVFLGIQIRCAECHDHPFTDWKQSDFWGLAAFFARVTGPGSGVELNDAPAGEVQHPKTMKTVTPVLLDGTHPVTDDSPRRVVFAHWVTAPDNPYFAQAAVNRVWSIMFGRGLVHPVDDFGEHNPPTHPAVLNLLAKDFREHGCDLRRTFRIIAGTRVYQLSSATVAGQESPLDAYAAMPVRSLSPRQVYDCLIQAAGRREPLDGADAAFMSERTTFLEQTEIPVRQATEFQGGIPQSLVLLNGPLIARLTDPSSGDRIAALIDSPFLTDAMRVDVLYLSALTRIPDESERAAALEWMHAGRDPGQALGDLLWALLNSSEFILNH